MFGCSRQSAANMMLNLNQKICMHFKGGLASVIPGRVMLDKKKKH